MKNWKIFYRRMILHKHTAETRPESISTIGEPESIFVKSMEVSFGRAKPFTLNEDLKEMLIRTDGTKEIDKIPFDDIFIDVHFDVSGFKERQFDFLITDVYGILISKVKGGYVTDANNITDAMQEKVKGDIFFSKKVSPETKEKSVAFLNGLEGYKVYILAVDKDENDIKGYGFNTINIVNKGDIYKDWNATVSTHQPKIRNFILNFLSNFFNLVNHEDSDFEFVEKEYSPAKNKRRMRQGGLPVPKSRVIVPVGQLRQYINKMKDNPAFSYTHRWWVRGHWRILRDKKRFKEKAGKKMWIKPFIKGQGILIDKQYEVKEK